MTYDAKHSAIQLAASALIAISTILGAAAPSAADVFEEHRWLTRSASAGEVQLPSLSTEREAELAEMEAGFTDLKQQIELSWEADGTVVERILIIRRYRDIDGIDQAGEMNIFAVPSSESVALHAAYTLTPEGERFDVDPLTMQVVDVEEARIFSGQKKVVLPLPALTEGATAILSYTIRNRAQEWPLPWARAYQLRSGHPAERLILTAKDMPTGIEWKTNDTNVACDEVARNLRCIKTRVLPLQPDIDLRLARDVIPLAVIGESLSWNEVSERVRRIVEPQIRKGVPAGTAAKIIASRDSELEQWEALFQFVADDIRYLGLEKGDSAVVPHAPAITLKRRFGDCKDKVALLVALARQANLKAYPVLVGTDYYDTQALILPSSNYFNHMVVCFTPSEGETRCADPTVNGTPSTETALSIAGLISLPLRETEDEAETLPVPQFGWSASIDGVTQINCDGSTQKTTTRRLDGLAKLSLKKQYLGIEPAMRKRFMLDEARRVTGTNQLSAIKLSGFRGRDDALTLSSSLTTPALGPLQADAVHVDRDPWMVQYGQAFRVQNQYFEAWSPGVEIRSTHRYEICDQMGTHFLGPTLEMRSEFGSLTRKYQRKASGLEVETVLQIPSGRTQPEDFVGLNHFLEQSLGQTLIWFSLESKR